MSIKRDVIVYYDGDIAWISRLWRQPYFCGCFPTIPVPAVIGITVCVKRRFEWIQKVSWWRHVIIRKNWVKLTLTLSRHSPSCWMRVYQEGEFMSLVVHQCVNRLAAYAWRAVKVFLDGTCVFVAERMNEKTRNWYRDGVSRNYRLVFRIMTVYNNMAYGFKKSLVVPKDRSRRKKYQRRWDVGLLTELLTT